jgi:hypothetical protein
MLFWAKGMKERQLFNLLKHEVQVSNTIWKFSSCLEEKPTRLRHKDQ